MTLSGQQQSDLDEILSVAYLVKLGHSGQNQLSSKPLKKLLLGYRSLNLSETSNK